jgi:hypothetical protein
MYRKINNTRYVSIHFRRKNKITTEQHVIVLHKGYKDLQLFRTFIKIL